MNAQRFGLLIVPTTTPQGSSSTATTTVTGSYRSFVSNHYPAGQFFHRETDAGYRAGAAFPTTTPKGSSSTRTRCPGIRGRYTSFQPLPRRAVLPPDFAAPRHQCGSRAPFASGPPSRPEPMPRRCSQSATHRIPAPTSTPRHGERQSGARVASATSEPVRTGDPNGMHPILAPLWAVPFLQIVQDRR